MKIEIVISRKGVMGITEGISVTISQHNGGTPSFEQLWASDSEGPKLDIYYREGISDLERRLEKWLQESSAQFDLQAIGEDYKLKLNVSRSWPTRLEGLLKNKVQDYLVHTVTAGWLNDFEGISVKQDYQAMAAQDLDDIVYIVGLKSFGFAEKERAGETDKDEETDGSAQGRGTDEDKTESGYTAEADERASDSDKSEETIFSDAEERGSDTNKDDNPYTVEAGERGKDTDSEAAVAQQRHTERTADSEKADNPFNVEANERTADESIGAEDEGKSLAERAVDNEKGDNTLNAEAIERGTDADKAVGLHADEADERNSDKDKATSDYSGKADERHSKNDNVNADKRNEAEAGDRNEDNDTVDIRHDFTDWSGTSPLLWEIDLDNAGRIIRHNQEYDKKI